MRKGFLLFFLLIGLLPEISMAWEAGDFEAVSTASDPCAGGLLAIIDRPTAGDSACTVYPGQFLLEAGGQYLKFTEAGSGYTVPNTALRFGFAGGNEFELSLPNYATQTAPDTTGMSEFYVVFKHALVHIQDGLFSIEGVATLPSGSAYFGSKKGGLFVNGLMAYSLMPDVGLSASLGVGSQSQSTAEGGTAYVSVNPDLVLTWNPAQWRAFQVVGEVYGQTKTSPGQGAGYNATVGLQYLVTREIELDVEEGVSLTGQLGGFDHYFGMGLGILF